MNIAITGSLGHIGKPLAGKLVEMGHNVTVISSQHARVTEITSLGAIAAIGSIDDSAFLQETFTGMDSVFCMTPPRYTAPDQLAYYENTAHNFANAISTAQVKRVVYLSSYGAHLPSGTGFITGSYRAEQVLNQLPGVSLTHLRPTFFYYNFFGFIPMIKSLGYMDAVYGGKDRLAMVASADIAAAAALQLTSPTDEHVVYVTSDDRTCEEVALVLGKAIGIPALEWRTLPQAQALQGLLHNGMPENAAKNLVELGTSIHSGLLREDLDKHMPEFGNITLEQFAEEFAAVYDGQSSSSH